MSETSPADACLSDDELAAVAAGELAASTAHLDRCAACRRAVSALAAVEGSVIRGDEPTLPAADDAAGDAPRSGQRIGRFTIVRKLGEGGMGQVWAARDPELEREVAIKLLHLRTDELGEHATLRLRREAQAMARLTHPNVVRIYELGVDGDRVFCAMELVDGVTLRHWLVTPRSWSTVLDVALAIGRGLAAAHAAGLVHRDIKPDNVLIARDGRILVTDFGLAKLVDADTGDAAGRPLAGAVSAVTLTLPDRPDAGARAVPATHTLDDLTAIGTVVGTPAYMAPEQLAGRRVDAQTDQFAYCVMIYEALFGARPFTGATIEELAAAMERGVPARERGAVPRAIVRCLERGLAHAPRERWPAMPALLAALDRTRTRRRRVRIAAGGSATLAAIAGAALGMWPAEVDRVGEVRAAAESRISRAWGPEQRAQLEARFLAAGGAATADEAAVVTSVLDAYRADWLAMRVDAWAAHHVRKEQSAQLLEQRLGCLDELAATLGAVVHVLATGDAAELARAPRIVHRLEPIATCGELHRLEARTPPPTTPAGKAAEERLRHLEALQLAGRSKEALAEAEQIAAEAEQLGDPGLLARAVHDLAIARTNVRHADGEATARRAIQLAAAARDHVLVAEGWLRLFNYVGVVQQRPQDARAFESAVRAAVAQAGNDPRQQAELEMTLGLIADAQYDLATAKRHLTEARERYIVARGSGHPLVAYAESNLGMVLMRLGDLDEANRLLVRALASMRESQGEHNPIVSPVLQNLSSIAARREDWPASEAHLRAAIVVNRRIYGDAHPELAKNHIFLARALREQRELAEAATALAEGRRLAEATLPAKHPLRAMLDVYAGQLAEAEGDFAEAERLGRRGLAAVRAADQVNAAVIGNALVEVARFTAHRAPAEALPLYEEALAIAVGIASRAPDDDVEILEGLARAALGAKQPARALRWFDRLPAAAQALPALRAELVRMRK